MLLKGVSLNSYRVPIKRLLLFVTMVIWSYSIFAKSPDVHMYIEDHKVFSKFLSMIYGIPAPLILSIAIVESSAGESDVAIVLHNHFGMAGKNKYITKKGTKSRYQQYANEWYSYVDFCKCISHKRYYRKLKNKKNLALWVSEMSKSGYSEVPEIWEEKILTTIKRYGLWRI